MASEYINSIKIGSTTYDLTLPKDTEYVSNSEFYCTQLNEAGTYVGYIYALKGHNPGDGEYLLGYRQEAGDPTGKLSFYYDDDDNGNYITMQTECYYTNKLEWQQQINTYKIPVTDCKIKKSYTLTVGTNGNVTGYDVLTIIRGNGLTNTYRGDFSGVYQDVVAFCFWPRQSSGDPAMYFDVCSDYSSGGYSSRFNRADSWVPVMYRRQYKYINSSKIITKALGLVNANFYPSTLPSCTGNPTGRYVSTMFYLTQDTKIHYYGIAD